MCSGGGAPPLSIIKLDDVCTYEVIVATGLQASVFDGSYPGWFSMTHVLAICKQENIQPTSYSRYMKEVLERALSHLILMISQTCC
jgi:hypothetical protein